MEQLTFSASFRVYELVRKVNRIFGKSEIVTPAGYMVLHFFPYSGYIRIRLFMDVYL